MIYSSGARSHHASTAHVEMVAFPLSQSRHAGISVRRGEGSFFVMRIIPPVKSSTPCTAVNLLFQSHFPGKDTTSIHFRVPFHSIDSKQIPRQQPRPRK